MSKVSCSGGVGSPFAIQKHPTKHTKHTFHGQHPAPVCLQLHWFIQSWVHQQYHHLRSGKSLSWGSNSSARAFTCSAMTSKTSSSWLVRVDAEPVGGKPPDSLSYKLEGDWHFWGTLGSNNSKENHQIIGFEMLKPSKIRLEQHLQTSLVRFWRSFAMISLRFVMPINALFKGWSPTYPSKTESIWSSNITKSMDLSLKGTRNNNPTIAL